MSIFCGNSTFLRKNRQNSVELTCLCVQNVVSYIYTKQLRKGILQWKTLHYTITFM